MSAKYSIDQKTKTLVFTGKPKLLTDDNVRWSDRNIFTSVVIPNSVSTIGKSAFQNYRPLTSIHMPNSVSFISEQAFSECSSLVALHIPSSVSSISHGGFCCCSSLTSVHIPNAIANIQWRAFYGCTSLASIYIPSSISSIDGFSFRNCSRLHKACVPNNSKNNNSSLSPFDLQTALLRPRLKPITSLRQKPACRASKASYSVFL